MDARDIYCKAMERAKNNGISPNKNFDIIVFLENEIEQYREKIKNLESYIEDLSNKNGELSFDVETGKNHINLLRDRVKELTDANTILEKTRENTMVEIIKALSDNGYNTIMINCYKDNESEV